MLSWSPKSRGWRPSETIGRSQRKLWSCKGQLRNKWMVEGQAREKYWGASRIQGKMLRKTLGLREKFEKQLCKGRCLLLWGELHSRRPRRRHWVDKWGSRSFWGNFEWPRRYLCLLRRSRGCVNSGERLVATMLKLRPKPKPPSPQTTRKTLWPKLLWWAKSFTPMFGWTVAEN